MAAISPLTSGEKIQYRRVIIPFYSFVFHSFKSN
jgi:hypothetical protein